MNYEKLSKLATLLDTHHGKPGEYGFIVGPHSEAQLAEHKKALAHSTRLFNYQPISDERLGVLSIHSGDLSHSRLEQMDHENFSNAELRPLLDEYMEFVRSRPY